MTLRRRLLTLVVGFIVAVAALATFTTTSAAARTSLETRVRDLSSAAPIIVGTDGNVSPAHVGFLRLPNPKFLSATGVATNTAGGMLGDAGTQVTSKTLYTTPDFHIDVENPAPGVRPGQLHIQDYAGNKYLYDFDTCEFIGIPRSLAKKLGIDPKGGAVPRVGARSRPRCGDRIGTSLGIRSGRCVSMI